MHVHRARIAGERVAPDALEQLIARQHDPAVVQQLPQQVELLRRKPDLLVDHVHLSLSCVDRQVAMPDLVRLALAALRRGAPENALHAGHELTRVEGLRHVVVGADLEPDDLVDVLVARREHEDRDVRRLADAAAELDAVAVGQVQVENDERRRVACQLDQSRLSRRGRLHAVARRCAGMPRRRRRSRPRPRRPGSSSEWSRRTPRGRILRGRFEREALGSVGSGVQLTGSTLQSRPGVLEYTPTSSPVKRGSPSSMTTPRPTAESVIPDPRATIRYPPPSIRNRRPWPR